MQHLFLSSSADDLGAADSIYRRANLNRPKTAFVLTPVEAEKMIGLQTWEDPERTALERAGFETFDYTITGKDINQIKSDLADIEALYITGGNEHYFREKCDESGFEEFVHHFVATGKPYIGTSCGSIMAGENIGPTKKLNDLSLLTKPLNT
jgi:peptidase E